MKRRWIVTIVLGILLSSIALALAYSVSPLPDSYLYVRAQASVVIGMVGVLFSLLVGIWLAVWHVFSTAQARIQARVVQERQYFIRRLDHELKNPITAVLAGLANMTTADSPGARAQAAESIRLQIHRLGQLVTDLRKLSEIEMRKLDAGLVDLNALFQNLYAVLQERPEAVERRLSLSLPSAPWPLPHIYGDGDLLFLAFYNLVDNALKFTRPGDTIEVRCYEHHNIVIIEIADTGPGIPEEEMALVWSELFRGEAARSIPGSGLGLALVKAILARHTATIELRSRVSEGTSVMVQLPVRHVPKR
jgi:two-component system OmpR family sensor kinase